MLVWLRPRPPLGRRRWLASPSPSRSVSGSTTAVTFVEEDFCESGLMVRFDQVIDGRFQAGARGTDGLIYFAEHVAFTSVL